MCNIWQRGKAHGIKLAIENTEKLFNRNHSKAARIALQRQMNDLNKMLEMEIQKMPTMSMRLAFRAEGDWWNAYLAQPNTMEGARKIGSILMGAINDERKKIFMDLMKDIMNEAIKETTGRLPDWWEEQPAPESERAGNA